ncbi:MAG TPA: M14 family metallopeptidase [Pyrinomonadaceae bacterium]|nr:M14 family metallopeptidase [Pyrinomonadaceae bacterium]
MPTSRFFIIVIFIFAFTFNVFPQDLKSRAELTNFEETSRYDDVIQFMTELQKRSPLIRVESFGETVEKRKMPLMILSDSGISTPSEAKAAGKPIIFIMGNIHAGEVEGKEAVQHLARRILFGDLKPLLSKLTILLAPIYNADGNEKFDLNNRTAQYGPIGGVGVRENSQKFDLNRDYMKLDSPEAQSLVNLFNRWDPHLTVDLHTTNGSYHGYHLTWSHPLNPNTDQRILDFQRYKMMPVIAKNLLKNHKFRNYYYGNFTGFSNLPKPGEKTTWEAFTHQPRIGQNYGGLRNRLTILSEAYSYLPFKRRIEVTERFVEEIFKYCAANSLQIMQLTKSADDETVRKFSGNEAVELGVAFKMIPLPKPVEILVGAVEKVKNPRNGKDMTAMIEDKFTPTKMEDFGMFSITRNVKAPRAYLFKKDAKIVEKLLQHGITVEELTSELNVEVDSFTIATFEKSKRPFQGHNEAKITGNYKQEKMTFPAGTILVRTAQPLGRLVFYLLEPESDDGLVNWNYFDDYLEKDKNFPVYKLMKNENMASRLVMR